MVGTPATRKPYDIPHHALPCADSSAGRLTSRQHNEIGVKIELHNFTRFEQSIVVRIIFGAGVENNMGLESSKIPCVAR
jgi:hypothetical protein